MNARITKATISIISFLLVFSIAVAFAEPIEPYANPVFESASASVGRNMDADFYAGTQLICTSIYVSSCTLQKQDANGNWSNVGSLTPPSYIAKNASDLLVSASYGSKCTHGNTYRIKAVFKAVSEGVTYSVTRYSNSVNY